MQLKESLLARAGSAAAGQVMPYVPAASDPYIDPFTLTETPAHEQEPGRLVCQNAQPDARQPQMENAHKEPGGDRTDDRHRDQRNREGVLDIAGCAQTRFQCIRLTRITRPLLFKNMFASVKPLAFAVVDDHRYACHDPGCAVAHAEHEQRVEFQEHSHDPYDSENTDSQADNDKRTKRIARAAQDR